MASFECFPTPKQEGSLQACMLPAAVTDFPAHRVPADIETDSAAVILLPLLHWRWPGQLPEDLSAKAESIRLALWCQRRERLALSTEIATTLGAAGIDPVFLKGAALMARYYPDSRLRATGDVDFLVPRERARLAAEALHRAGWKTEHGLPSERIEDQTRIRHAWHLFRENRESEFQACDLHWSPVQRCYSPRVVQMFFHGSETVQVQSGALRVPCATDLLFNVLAHGLHPTWTSSIRWIPDAWFVLKSGAVDWQRLRTLCSEANMTFRVYRALDYLKTRFEVSIPDEALSALADAPSWESSEQAIIEKPLPLSLRDQLRSKVFTFRRLRQIDPPSRESGRPPGFLSDSVLLFHVLRRSELRRAVWRKVRDKLERRRYRHARKHV